MTSVGEELEGRGRGVHGEEAAAILGEDTNILATRGTTSAELGQREESLVAHSGNEDGVELEGREEPALGRLGRWAERPLEGHGTTVGDISEVIDVGSATDGTAGVKYSDRLGRHAEHGLGADDNKFRVMVIGGESNVRRSAAWGRRRER